MSSLKQTLVKTSGLLAALAASDNPNVSIVTTDTLVIGGGAGGAHAAVRLTDYGQDVILVERQPILVGFSCSAETNVLNALISSFRAVLSTVSPILLREGRPTLVLGILLITETSRVSLVASIFLVSDFNRQPFSYPGNLIWNFLRSTRHSSVGKRYVRGRITSFNKCL